jgi:nitrate/nitrite transport system ATP-binding protein
MSLLQIENGGKSFGEKQVLRNVNLELSEGEFVTVIGYSGSGKTTLVSLLAGLLEPDTGSVLLNGAKIQGPGLDRGVVFQNYSLLPWMTVEENVGLAVGQAFPTYTPGEVKEHTAKFVNMVKLGPAMKKLPKQLSGGMRQRVALARGLSMQPKILLLDEPLSALDALTRAVLQEEISQMRNDLNCTVLWVTNDPDEALLLADRVIPLTPGPGATLDTPIEVPFARPRNRRELAQDSDFQAMKFELTSRLRAMKAEAYNAALVDREPPNILPEDLTRINTVQFLGRKGPLRRKSN